MPRIRTIKPKFWDDIKLSKISRDARLLFIGIWNFSDDLGVIVAEPDYIKSKVFPYDKLDPEQFGNWINELVLKKFIIPITFNDELFFFIRTFDRHQRIEKPNHIDICIDKEVLMKIIEQSRINPVSIQDLSENDTVSIEGGMEGKGKDRIVKERSADFEKKNDISFQEFTPNGNYPVPKMQVIWMKYKPDYAHDEQRDYEPLRHIWEFIAKQEKVKKDNRPECDKVLEAFEFISKFVSKHDFFKTYSLKQIDTHIQSIIQNIQNGKGTKSKQATGKDVDVQSAFDKLDSFYAKNGG